MIMLKDYPLVSVVIPVYNREDLIKRAICSILNQSYQNFEIIVIDDGSKKDIESILLRINDKRIKYYRNSENMGVAYSRNRGVKMASGLIIVFQDSDDESYPDRIKKTVEVLLRSSDDVAAVHCGRDILDSRTGNKIGVNLRETDFAHNFTKGSYFLTPGTGTLTIKKEIFDTVGFFDQRMRTFEDTEFAIRVSAKYKFNFIREPLIKVYRHHDQLRANTDEPVKSREVIYHKHKSYLSPVIVYGLCKAIANHYILNGSLIKAKYYIKEALKYKFELKTVIQYSLIVLVPFIIKSFYNLKYKKGKSPFNNL